MPIYEYECSHCRYYLEVIQKISAAPLKKCPSCGRSTLKKLISAPVFRLKGSGWYETDFKSDQEQKRNLAGADKQAPSGDSKDAKESKDVKGTELAAGAAEPKAAAPAEAKSASGGEGKTASPAEPAEPAKPQPGGGKASTHRRSSRGRKRAPTSASERAGKTPTKPGKHRGRR